MLLAGRRGDVIEQAREPAVTPPVTDTTHEPMPGPIPDPTHVGPDRDEPTDEAISAVFARLYEDGRSYAQAELDRQKLRVGIIGAGVRDAAIFAMVAIMLLFAALVALLIGLIFALSPDLGRWGAIGAVLSSTVIVSLVLLLLAKARIGRMKKATKG